jgi:chromosome segregation protein
MLRIESLQVKGFKSFPAKTELSFGPGLTAIIGPNGCGKSNISDAISWVIGEQSLKSLRSVRSEDLIFNGTRGKRPMGMAEVSLRLQNGQGPEGELEITRRLFRSGDSEFRLNGAPCRLMDIQQKVEEIQIGGKTYSIIDQGHISSLISSKPADRKVMIEEAAGIYQYRRKRRLALHKLEETQANLLRLSDILAELERQMSSLQRQAARARRYRRLRELQRQLDGLLLARRHRQGSARAAALLGEREALDRSGSELRQQQETAVRALAALRFQVERREQQLRHMQEHKSAAALREQQARTAIETHRESAASLTQRAAESRGLSGQMLERAARRDRELAELVAQRERLDRMLEDLEQRVGSGAAALSAGESETAAAESQLENAQQQLFHAASASAEREAEVRRYTQLLQTLEGRREALQSKLQDNRAALTVRGRELEELRQKLGEGNSRLMQDLRLLQLLEATLEERREAVERAEAQARQAREQRQQIEIRLESLHEVDSAGELLEEGARALRQEGSLQAAPQVADLFEVPKELEVAVECYLGSLLGALVASSAAQAAEALERLRKESLGRCALLFPGRPRRAALAQTVRSQPEVEAALFDLIRMRHPAGEALLALVEDAAVVADMAAGRALQARFPELNVLCRSGAALLRSSLAIGGSSGAGGQLGNLLTLKRLVRELAAELEIARNREAQRSAESVATGSARAECEAEFSGLKETLRQGERATLEFSHRIEKVQALQLQLQAAGAALERDLGEITGEAERYGGQHQEATVRLAEASATRSEREHAAASCKASSERARRALIEARDGLERLRLDQAKSASRRAALIQQLEAGSAEVGELNTRSQKALADCEALVGQCQAQQRAAQESESELDRALTELEQQEQDQRAAERELTELRERIGNDEQRLEALRSDREGLTQKALELEAESARSAADLEHLRSECRDKLDLALEELAARPEPEEFSGRATAELEQESEQVRRRLEELGPVNLLAIEEYQELETRAKFLGAERDDLTAAIEELHKLLAEMDERSRSDLERAREIINQHFGGIFATLFGGGTAELRFTNAEDVLNSEIDIFVQPPGKAVRSLDLLSGGEKAMSALALLMAILRYRPSPFVILDEVDGPLDDRNVERFTSLLREYSRDTQFIVITHNKKTMEAVDVIYGVTMAEPGISKVLSVRLADGEPQAAESPEPEEEPPPEIADASSAA